MSARRATPVDILDDILSGQSVQENARGALVWLPVGRIYDNPWQTRLAYDDDHIQRLADNIWSLREELPATLGMQQPPVARVMEFTDGGDEQPLPRTAYTDQSALLQRVLGPKCAVQIHFGHNRLRAWKLLRERDQDGYAEFPVFLAYADDQAMWRHAVSENAQRKDITPIEEALSLQQAISRFGLTQRQAGEPFGYINTTVSNKLRLLELPEQFRSLLVSSQLSERHGRALLTLAPAPALWNLIDAEKLVTNSVADLEAAISRLIAKCQPLPPAPGTGYKRPDGNWNGSPVGVVKCDPPAWPYNWTPVNPPETSGIVGACDGCQYRIQFGGDAGPRCVQGMQTCWGRKAMQWRTEQAQAQEAALSAQQAQQAQAVRQAKVQLSAENDARIKAAIGDRKLVDLTEEDWVAVKATPLAELAALPPAGPKAPVNLDAKPIDITWFSTRYSYSAPAALIEQDLCNAQRCACFLVGYNPQPEEHHVRPDAEHAPNLCYGCTSTARLANRRLELEHGDVKAHRQRVKAEQDEAERLLRAAVATYSADDLWHNPVFLRQLVGHGAEIEHRYESKDWDLYTLQERLFVGVAANRCRNWTEQKQVWILDQVQAWIAELETAMGRHVEPLLDEEIVAVTA